MNYIYSSIAIILVLLGVEQYGEHRIKTQWNLETARIEAVVAQQKSQNEANIKAINEQHLKDIQNAQSEAGKSAIRDYLRTHGVLFSKGSNNQTPRTTAPNEPSSQCGIGNSIEEFAGRCAQDALTILEWQEWAQREGLETQ